MNEHVYTRGICFILFYFLCGIASYILGFHIDLFTLVQIIAIQQSKSSNKACDYYLH